MTKKTEHIAVSIMVLSLLMAYSLLTAVAIFLGDTVATFLGIEPMTLRYSILGLFVVGEAALIVLTVGMWSQRRPRNHLVVTALLLGYVIVIFASALFRWLPQNEDFQLFAATSMFLSLLVVLVGLSWLGVQVLIARFKRKTKRIEPIDPDPPSGCG